MSALHVVVMGVSGCGKSAVGAELASTLDRAVRGLNGQGLGHPSSTDSEA